MIESLMKMNKQDYDKVAEDLYSKMGMKRSANENFWIKTVYASREIWKDSYLEWNSMLMDMNYGGWKHGRSNFNKSKRPVDEKYFEIPKNIKFSICQCRTEGYEERKKTVAMRTKNKQL